MSVTRSSNLELFRIVAMFGIILSHYQVYLFDLMAIEPTSALSIFHYSLSSLGKIGINSFMLITGYFMCTQETSIKKYIKLLAQIYFYAIIIKGVFVFTGDLSLSLESVLDIVFPFRKISMDSFVTDFLWFYLFIPFIKILVDHLSQTQHRRILTLSVLMFCTYTSLPGFNTELCSVTWFSVLMLLSSYVRFYGIPFFEKKKLDYKVWGIICLISLFAIISCITIANHLGMLRFSRIIASRPSFFLMLLSSFSMFLYFLGLPIRHNKFINILGGVSFGVLLIHTCGDPMRCLIFEKIVKTREQFIAGHWWMPLVTATAIYIICGFVEYIRQKTIEKPILGFLYKVMHLPSESKN